MHHKDMNFLRAFFWIKFSSIIIISIRVKDYRLRDGLALAFFYS